MSKPVPFVAHVSIVPERPGKRHEYTQSMSKIASLVYDALQSESSINLAIPGGGQSPAFGDINARHGFGNYTKGVATKPQIGASPAQLMIVGFYTSVEDNDQIWASHQLISGSTIYSGYSSNSALAVPTSTFNAEVKALRTLLNNTINTAIPATIEYEIFRIEYSGVVFGDKGFTFPR